MGPFLASLGAETITGIFNRRGDLKWILEHAEVRETSMRNTLSIAFILSTILLISVSTAQATSPWADPSGFLPAKGRRIATSGDLPGESPIARFAPFQDVLSDGQFVWGPNVGSFDVRAFLEEQHSPLLAYANAVESAARYASVNPRVLIAMLQTQYRLLRHIPGDAAPDQIRALIEETASDLAFAFYQHLYAWGSRRHLRSAEVQPFPEIRTADGSIVQLDLHMSSGSYAVASSLGRTFNLDSWAQEISPEGGAGFSQAFASLFPDEDPLDTSNDINPPGPPPDDLFQFPFPLGASWRFSGPHSWFGGDTYPDRSSMDFSTSWANYPDRPYKNSVAAAAGDALIRTPGQTSSPCWVAIDHGGGWSTSYYHLINLGDPGALGTMTRNQLIGSIGTETCNGGFASGPHVHFTLLYNGALVDLEGVKLSGWTIHVGPDGSDPYASGYLERDGMTLSPGSAVENDYHIYYGSPVDYSLRFSGHGAGDFDRLKIPIDDPIRDVPGPPVDVGFHDFAVEWWMKAEPGMNSAPAIACGDNDRWKNGNSILDRSRSAGTSEWGVSMAGGRIAFGITGPTGEQKTICSSNVVDDGQWHHILVQRNRFDSSSGLYADGQLWLFIDGILQETAIGPIGDISYPDDEPMGMTCGPGGTEACLDDPYLVIGARKYDLGPAFTGWLDDIRIAWWLRSLGDFVPPGQPLVPDSETVALLSLNEGRGDVIYDTAGYDGGTSQGRRFFGGSPAGPEWLLSDRFIQYQQHYFPVLFR